MMDIKAIETKYNGYRFRSRLEARWAVFFDAAGIKYEYEPEGYENEMGSRYLPDFFLPDFYLHVEVKRNTEDGIAEILDKCENAIQWGGPIQQILILSEVPEGRSIDGGIWHFPVLFWKADNVHWGWSFFHDCYNEKEEPIFVWWGISNAGYPYSRWRAIKDKTIGAVSDYELREKSRGWKEIKLLRKVQKLLGCSDYELTLEEKIQMQEEQNSLTFSAFAKARSAQFEFKGAKQ
jgi:hypothetical protein